VKLPKLRQAALRMRHVFAETLLVFERTEKRHPPSGRISARISPWAVEHGLTRVVPPGLLGLLRSLFRVT